MCEEKNGQSRRQYPRLYERLVPVALGIIVLAILVMVIVILAVALGLFPGS
jgi:hypothetical protein